MAVYIVAKRRRVMKYSVVFSFDELFDLACLVSAVESALLDRIAEDEGLITPDLPATHPFTVHLAEERCNLCKVDSLLNILHGALRKGGETDES